MSDTHTLVSGEICYLELPAVDVRISSAFYENVFRWQIRQCTDGTTAFDDATGGVSGTWVLGRAPLVEPELVVYIMVDSVSATLASVIAQGGELIEATGEDVQEVSARFRDPAGNVMGLCQERAQVLAQPVG